MNVDRARARRLAAELSDLRTAACALRDALVLLDPDGHVRWCNPAAQRLLDMLAQWDGNMDPGAQAPSAYYLVRQEMTRILARRSGLDAAADDIYASMAAPGVVPVNQLWWTLPDLLRRDDTSLLAGATWDEVIREALLEVAGGQVAQLLDRPGLHLAPPRHQHARRVHLCIDPHVAGFVPVDGVDAIEAIRLNLHAFPYG